MKNQLLGVFVLLRATLFGLGIFISNAYAQSPPACAGEEFRQMDFWLGNWDLSWTPTAAGDPGKGSNEITLIMDDCVVQESFNGAGAIGHSVSIYHAPAQKWRQTWVDNVGGYYALVGGPDAEGFRLDMTRISDRVPYMRMIWRNIENDSMDWHWQRSPDEGNTWEDSWVIHYARRK